MFEWVNDKKLLKASKIPIKEPSTKYKDSDLYISYMQYVKDTVKTDVQKFLIPAINEALGGTEELPELWLKSIRTSEQNSYTTDKLPVWDVQVRLATAHAPTGGEEFPIFVVPHMDRFGMIVKNGKQYAVICAMQQDDDVTFSRDGELKIVASSGRSLIMNSKKKSPVIKFLGKNKHAYSVMAALAIQDGLKPEEMIKHLSTREAYWLQRDENASMQVLDRDARSLLLDGLHTLFHEEYYKVTNVRERMNTVFSLERALNKTLARDIEVNGRVIAQRGDLIDRNLLRLLSQNMINVVHVKTMPNLVGMLLRESIAIDEIKCGTTINEFIRHCVPNPDDLYVAEDIKLEQPIIIYSGTAITQNLLEMLEYNGIQSIRVAQSMGKKESEYRFEYDVVGNNHFHIRHEDGKREWVYFNEATGQAEPASDYITAYDVLAMISIFPRLYDGEDLTFVSDKDLGLRKKVNQTNELFHEAFENAVSKYIRKCKRKLNVYAKEKHFTTNTAVIENHFYAFQEAWWSELREMKVIDVIDWTNPVSVVSTMRRINTFIDNPEAISNTMHALTARHYGRLCPYETPQSKKLGVVNTKAIGCKIENGKLLARYYKLRSIGGSMRLEEKETWLTVEQEEDARIADITSLTLDRAGNISSKGRVLARIPQRDSLEKGTMAYIDIKDVEYVNVDPNDHISPTISIIPFAGSDDATRVMFGGNMCRQAKPLLDADVPVVMTSWYQELLMQNNYFLTVSEGHGTIIDVTGENVYVLYDDGQEAVYPYKTHEVHPDAILISNPVVKPNQRVKPGDVLIESNHTKEGFLANGKNMLCAYLPVGYNYEDGVFVSTRVRQKLTSFGHNIERTPISKGAEASPYQYASKFQYLGRSQKLYSVNVFRDGKGAATHNVYSKGLTGFLIDVSKEEDTFTKSEKSVVACAVSFDMLNRGDKLANRHGNKGVVPRTELNSNMPIAANGEFVDICYNPAGVTSRMNIGQVLEANTGLAAYVLGIRVMTDSFNSINEKEIKALLSYAYDMANSPDPEKLDSKHPMIPKEMHKFCMSRISEIQSYAGVFDRKGEATLINPKTGKPYDGKVTLGVTYSYKLVQEVARKVHARGGYATEPYVRKFDAPTKGSINDGGQQCGYMEVSALHAYGASAFLYELMNERGDNGIARCNVTSEALLDSQDYHIDESLGIRRATEAFVEYMMGLGCLVRFENGELPNATKRETAKREYYHAETLILASNTGSKVQGTGLVGALNKTKEKSGDGSFVKGIVSGLK